MSHAWRVLKHSRTRIAVQIIVIIIIYFVVGKLGLTLAFVNLNVTAIWPPSGIALAAVLLFGYRIVPAIFIGAFLVNVTTAGSVATSLGIALGNALECIIGAFLVNRFANGYQFFERAQDIFKFTILAALLSTAISALFGVTSLLFGGHISLATYQEAWLTWWFGDAGGILVFTPFIILWAKKRSFLLRRKRMSEALLQLSVLLLICEVVFGGISPFPYVLSYLCIPVLMWIALRRTQTESMTGVFLIFLFATINTFHKFGPFLVEGVTVNQSLMLLQLFLGTVSAMTLTVSSIVAEQKKIDEIRERLATIVDSSEDAIYSMTLRGIVTTWNMGATKIFGYTPKEIIGKSVTKIFPENKKNELHHIITIVKKGKYITPYETERKTKEGKVIPVSIAISPLKDSNGETVEISKIARDISREKELEKRKDEFISMASHELNTPITGLSIYVQALTKLFQKRGDEDSIAYLSKMDSQILRVRHIIRDLLDISRIRLGLLTFYYSSFDMNILVKEIAEVAQYMSKHHKIIVEGRVKKPLFITGDRDRIAQVLTNLFSNARKYSPMGRKILVNVKSTKEVVVVSVQDFGIGIGKKHQKKVFELFYRIQEYHGKTFPGMGIGLYLSFQIIDEHKGKMWFESIKGKGTTFYFALPLDANVQKG